MSAFEHGASLNSNSQYLADSRVALSTALGKGWDSKQLEKDADEKMNAFVSAITNAKAFALGGIGRITDDIAAALLR